MHRVWCFCSLLLLALLSSPLCAAKETAYYNDEKFNKGGYGNYPKRRFKTTKLTPPRPNIMRNFTNCDDGSYIFVAPRGHITRATFFILDHNLEMVWGPDHRFGKIYNFQVQHYKGEPFLAFWAGDDTVGGHGVGKYYMLNQNYEESKKILAGEGLRGDLHSFSITPDDTAVYTIYDKREVDLTILGKSNVSYVWEGMFQELDIETGNVIFEWRAADHFGFDETYAPPNGANKNHAWDWFHINMVEKDRRGNYLVSSRYGRCALYIEKRTGKVLWQLGGKKNSFKDLSDGKATTFLGQHDIHWDGDDRITMFDNRGDWWNKLDDESIGHRIKLDLKKMTAKLEQDFYHPKHILSTSQGSFQTLPNKHALLGYGHNALFAEFDADGNCLCDATFLPLHRLGTGDVQNYRALKFNWTGIPLSVPALVHEDNTLYMSWLGSTKLRKWLIEDSDAADGEFQEAHLIPKDGFETEHTLSDGPLLRQYVRVVAVDEHGKHLSTSRPVDLVDPQNIGGEGLSNIRPPSSSSSMSGTAYDNHDDEELEEYHSPDVYGDEPDPYAIIDDSAHKHDLLDESDETIEEEEEYRAEGDPWTYVPDHPDLPDYYDTPNDSKAPVTTPAATAPQIEHPPPETEQIVDEPPKPPKIQHGKGNTFTAVKNADDVTDDQVLLVLGLVFGVGAALFVRMFCWRRASGNTAYRSHHFWNRARSKSTTGGKTAYAYGELPTTER